MQDFYTNATQSSAAAAVTAYTVGDNETRKYGIIEIDGDGVICGFLEKPEPEMTNSRLACPCFYFFKEIFQSHDYPTDLPRIR